VGVLFIISVFPVPIYIFPLFKAKSKVIFSLRLYGNALGKKWLIIRKHIVYRTFHILASIKRKVNERQVCATGIETIGSQQCYV